LVSNGFSYRALFWLTGLLAFFISPIADNLTTALIMCAVVLSVGKDRKDFVSLSCINIVVAANAGGAFSPFGDITTLMVWQKGILPFASFFHLFIPAAVSFIVPAVIMSLFLPKDKPEMLGEKKKALKFGGIFIVILFLITVFTAISFHSFLSLPPVFGMMLGLAYLKFFGFYLRRKEHVSEKNVMAPMYSGKAEDGEEFDIFDHVSRAEWDTLFFFYGVIMSVGGLAYMGYLSIASNFIYGELGHTTANVLVGVISSIVDNIPVMFAVLTMNPDMNEVQWLLVTLTAGIGGSLLSIGSAAGVALMGQARGHYTFFSHLKWTPVIAIGYALGIYCHFLING
jgi:Na+/H+ antiporter NhaD/arsenite permease-like protein